jgi:hypothetical protein
MHSYIWKPLCIICLSAHIQEIMYRGEQPLKMSSIDSIYCYEPHFDHNLMYRRVHTSLYSHDLNIET